MKYLLGADIGTTSLKMTLFTQALEPVKTVTRDYTLIAYGDRVEFPAEQYWEIFQDAYDEVCGTLSPAALTIDTQCETMILTDGDGRPLRDAIVWLDNRAERQAEEIRQHFGEQRVYEVSGQPEITATWPACKLLWVKENEPDIFSKIWKIIAVVVDFPDVPPTAIVRTLLDISAKSCERFIIGMFSCNAF